MLTSPFGSNGAVAGAPRGVEEQCNACRNSQQTYKVRAGGGVNPRQQSEIEIDPDATSLADQLVQGHAETAHADDNYSVVSQFSDDSHQWVTNFSTRQAPVFELHIDEQLRAQLPRNDAEYSTSFIYDMMLSRGIRPPADLHQNRGKRVKYLLSTRSVALPKAAQDTQQLRISNLLTRVKGFPRQPKDIGALSQVAAHAKALVQVSAAAAVAAKAEAAIASQFGCEVAANTAQKRAVEAVAVADRVCKDAAAAAGDLHMHTALLRVLEEERTLRVAWQGYTCKQAAAAAENLARKEDACTVAVDSDKNHRMSIIKSVQAAIDTAVKSAATTEREDRAQQRDEEKAMHKQALQDSSITAEFYLRGTLHLISVGERQQQQPQLKSPNAKPAPATVDPDTTVGEVDEWRQLQHTQTPLARLATLRSMIRSGVMPFGLPEATKRDTAVAVLRGMPWLCRTKQQLLRWEQQCMASMVQAQINGPQPTRNQALRQLLTHAVRHVLAAPERYCELMLNARRLQLAAGSSLPHHHNTSLRWLEQGTLWGRAQSVLHCALMRALRADEAGTEEQQLRQAMHESHWERRYQSELRGYARTAYPGLQDVLQEQLQQGRAAAEQRMAWLMPT